MMLGLLAVSLLIVGCQEDLTQEEQEIFEGLEELEGDKALAGQAVYDSTKINQCRNTEGCWSKFRTDCYKVKCYGTYSSGSTAWGNCVNNCLDEAMGVSEPVGEIDLSDYPSMFVTNSEFDGLIVVGQNAAAIDVLPAVYVAGNMWYTDNSGSQKLVPIKDEATLDVFVNDAFAQNVIFIGGPCINNVAADIFGNPQQCNEISSINNGNSFISQTGNIKLIKHDNGNYGLLIGGFAGQDSILAAQVLAHRSDELDGMEVIVTSPDGTWQNAEITMVS